MDKEKLTKWTSAPGLSDLARTQEVYNFLEQFNQMLEIYRAAYGDPLGKSVESHMDTVNWYLHYHLTGQGPAQLGR